jgi:hypothetical protein
MDSRYFRTSNGELVATRDRDVADLLAGEEGYRELDPRTAAAATRAGDAPIPWPGTAIDLGAVRLIRAASTAAPGTLHIRLGHVPQAKPVEQATDRELAAAVVAARQEGEG